MRAWKAFAKSGRNHSWRNHSWLNQKGFTLVESAVALSILISGIAIFLWQLRQQSHVSQGQVRKLYALEAAQSDIESLQAMPPDWMQDTDYTVPGPGVEKLRVVRLVYDTADFENSTEELKLGPDLLPLALKEPREVQVKVYRADADGKLMADPMDSPLSLLFSPSWSQSSDPKNEPEPLLRLTARLPQYLP